MKYKRKKKERKIGAVYGEGHMIDQTWKKCFAKFSTGDFLLGQYSAVWLTS